MQLCHFCFTFSEPLESKYQNYVIDIAVCGEEKSCFVIELNPWEAGTSSCLFPWNVDHDLLYNESCIEVIRPLTFVLNIFPHLNTLCGTLKDKNFKTNF